MNITKPPYNAIGDGVTNNTATITRAINDLQSSKGGEIFFPSGDYKISSLQIPSGPSVSFCGEGICSNITTSSAEDDVVTFSSNNCVVRNMRFTAIPIRTNGAFIILNGASCVVENCFIDRDFIGIKLVGTASRVLFNVFTLGAPGARRIWATGGDTSHLILGNLMNSQFPDVVSAGIYTDNTVALKIQSNDIVQQGRCLHINPSVGQTVSYLYASGNFFDTALGGVVIEAAGTFQQSTFVNNWTGHHSEDGVLLSSTGTGTVTGVDFVAHEACQNGGNGFSLVGSRTTNVRIRSSKAKQNLLSGFAVDTGVSGFLVEQVGFNPSDGYVANGQAIFLGGSNDQYQISDCDLSGNPVYITGHLGYSPTRRVYNNIGYVTSSSGSSFIATRSTSVTINHGLSEEPRSQDVMITPTIGTGSNPAFVDTTSITAAHFIIRCANPATSTVDFSWRVRVGDF